MHSLPLPPLSPPPPPPPPSAPAPPSQPPRTNREGQRRYGDKRIGSQGGDGRWGGECDKENNPLEANQSAPGASASFAGLTDAAASRNYRELPAKARLSEASSSSSLSGSSSSSSSLLRAKNCGADAGAGRTFVPPLKEVPSVWERDRGSEAASQRGRRSLKPTPSLTCTCVRAGGSRDAAPSACCAGAYSSV